MSSVDLVILGYLKKQPASAYDLAQTVEGSQIKKIIKIGSPTIYQNIKKLASRGYLSTTPVRQGEMPEKTIYTLTQEGEAYFLRLMEQHAADPGPMFFNFNSFIKNLSLVDRDSGLAMLNSLRRHFYETRADLENDQATIYPQSFEIKAILSQYQILLQGMITWIDQVIAQYRDQQSAD